MKSLVKNFLKADDGGTVVDMTMLMAALVGLAIAVTAQVSGGMEDLTGELETVMIDHDAGAAWN
jgi:Flp pilus assembly pilin Flp